MARAKSSKSAPRWPADTVERWPIERLAAYARNAKKHSDGQVADIARSITEYGFTVPVLAAEDGTIIAGHGRVLAAQTLDIGEIPVIVARGWSDAKRRAYTILDNRLGETGGGWDEELLRIEMIELQDDGVDIGLLGFDSKELGRLLNAPGEGLTDPDEAPAVEAAVVSRIGDIWTLGAHRLICGDATDGLVVAALLDGTVPDLANCDPPYGISIVKSTSDGCAKPFAGGKGRVHAPAQLGPALRGRVHGPARKALIQPGHYAPIIGDDSTETAIESYAVLTEIGVKTIVLWGGNYFANELPPSRCWLVWDKENTGSFADVELAWTNRDAIARLFRHRWSGLMKASERGEKRVHPTQKPVALAEWVIETVAPEAETVVDLFVGSGSGLIAAERKGLRFYGAEMAPAYVDVAVRRWQAYTGKAATLSDGRSFEDVAADRIDEAA